MGQRLLLAVSLLISARIVTFISPLPAETEAGKFSRDNGRSVPEATQPVARVPVVPQFPSNGQGVPATLDSQASQPLPSESPELSDRNEMNPVQGWEAPPSATYEARLPSVAGTATSSVSQVCEALKPAVVTVHAGREIGSGSIVSPDGLVITNHHVVRRLGQQSLSVRTQDGGQYPGQVIASDRRNDLALIQLQTQHSLPSVPISATNSPTLGQPVCAIGSPFGQAGTITVGQLVRILPNGDLQSDVELQPGNSGGPLINAQGEMIGVNKGVARGRRQAMAEASSAAIYAGQVSYATNSAVANRFVQQNRTSAAIVPNPGLRSTP